jgi:hypothetical protein
MSDFDEPWRYRCPEGHASWHSPEYGRYYCRSCSEGFDELVDAKELGDDTERSVPVSEDPALEDVDDQTRRGVVALFDLKQTHLGGE